MPGHRRPLALPLRPRPVPRLALAQRYELNDAELTNTLVAAIIARRAAMPSTHPDEHRAAAQAIIEQVEAAIRDDRTLVGTTLVAAGLSTALWWHRVGRNVTMLGSVVTAAAVGLAVADAN